jgi:hypothetical protein
MTSREAVLSSRIEGTQATLEEVLEQDAGIEQSKERRDDIFEIFNYKSAVRIAERELDDRRLSLSLIKAIHQRLMRGVIPKCVQDDAIGRVPEEPRAAGRLEGRGRRPRALRDALRAPQGRGESASS